MVAIPVNTQYVVQRGDTASEKKTIIRLKKIQKQGEKLKTFLKGANSPVSSATTKDLEDTEDSRSG